VDTLEYCFDGLVGPTHNYAALSVGNLASMQHGNQVSHPKEAALQGLAKMALLRKLGIAQGVFPPHERPSLSFLRSLGFSGTEETVLRKAGQQAPFLLTCASSASAMWTANSCTTTPSSDAADGKVHFTPANLASKLHRSIEASFTSEILRTVFPQPSHFVHHSPLPASDAMGDEGAANHTRLCASQNKRGLHLFVYGKQQGAHNGPKVFAARQSREASESIARLHEVPTAQTIFAKQSAHAIDAGVFHNDVVSVGNENLFFYHESCFENENQVIEEMKTKWAALTEAPLAFLKVSESEVPLSDVIRSYLFNSQLVSLPNGKMALIAPSECDETESVKKFLQTLGSRSGGRIAEVHTPRVRESMRNGGGPACLRLRVVLNKAERAAALPGVFLDDAQNGRLETWVRKHYRDELKPSELADPQLLKESRTALDELTQILGLGSLYAFQK
jgi:succinylarginine dihydrolase